MTSIKHLRDSRAAQSSKLRKLGAQGNLKAARHAEHAPRKYNDDRARYADGGMVGDIGGMPSKPRLDRPGRSMKGKGKGKKAGTNVNVIVMPKGSDGPPPGPPMGGPPMPPPGAGGPPPMPPPGPPGGPPMRASGGRIANLGKYAHGGKVKKADGGWIGEGDSDKSKSETAAPQDRQARSSGALSEMNSQRQQLSSQSDENRMAPQMSGLRKRGGAVKKG